MKPRFSGALFFIRGKNYLKFFTIFFADYRENLWMDTSEFTAGHRNSPALKLITGFFWIILGAAVLLALMILLLPDKLFLALSNYLQIIAAIAGALVLLYVWHRDGGPEYLLYAAGALGLWGISNIVWYINILMGLRNEVFPSLIDMGIIASIMILSIAIQKGFPRKQIAPHILLGILILSLAIPVGVLVTTGISAAALVTLLYFFACGSLVITGLNHSLSEHPKILAGILLFVIAFLIYPLREMFLIANPVLPVIGTFVAAGFSLIVIGLVSNSTPATTA
ncbi:MAG: hypothetical protein CVV30_12075 [Methanomicrobiales archaeon HGW-Methanomicrobiales-1]|jgi:hypothetical protein|nr:MAG: hypothetical protein CVV30_12075 [Methanomicrobiales archaeon HGW-Methanomicrobiales-1]